MMEGFFNHPIVLVISISIVFMIIQRVITAFRNDCGLTNTDVLYKQSISVVVCAESQVNCRDFVSELFQRASQPYSVHLHLIKSVAPGKESISLESKNRVATFIYRVKEKKFDVARCTLQVLKDNLHLRDDFACVLPSNVRLVDGWDSILIDQWNKCSDEAAVLTCKLNTTLQPSFIRPIDIASPSGNFEVESVPFFETPEFPQPSIVCNSCLWFAKSETCNLLPSPSAVSLKTSHFVVSLFLWMGGCNFYSPVLSIGTCDASDPLPKLTSDPVDVEKPSKCFRTLDEFHFFTGIFPGKNPKKRTLLGLSPSYGTIEAFSKYGFETPTDLV